MKNRLLSPTNAMATITILAGLLGVTKESIAQNLANNQKNKNNIVNTNTNTLKVDPFDRVKWYVNTSDPVEVAHYDLLLKTEKTQNESHILWLKVALLALYNDTTIPPQDKKALALLVFENGIVLAKWTPNSDFYTKKYEQRLENDEFFFNLCVKFGEMQGNLMAEISSQALMKTIKEGEQLDKQIALLKQILEAYESKNK